MRHWFAQMPGWFVRVGWFVGGACWFVRKPR
jgi:hypothetical protein